MDYEDELGAFYFLLEETDVIAESADDWEPWGPFETYQQVMQSWEKLTSRPVTEVLDGLGFFVLWNSVKSSLPELCAERFEEYPPNDLYLPGAVLTSLLNADGFDTFAENLSDYLAGIDDELEAGVSKATPSLAKWWESSREQTLSEIFNHSAAFRSFLTQS